MTGSWGTEWGNQSPTKVRRRDGQGHPPFSVCSLARCVVKSLRERWDSSSFTRYSLAWSSSVRDTFSRFAYRS